MFAKGPKKIPKYSSQNQPSTFLIFISHQSFFIIIQIKKNYYKTIFFSPFCNKYSYFFFSNQSICYSFGPLPFSSPMTNMAVVSEGGKDYDSAVNQKSQPIVKAPLTVKLVLTICTLSKNPPILSLKWSQSSSSNCEISYYQEEELHSCILSREFISLRMVELLEPVTACSFEKLCQSEFTIFLFQHSLVSR
jgi:hypothetical protein